MADKKISELTSGAPAVATDAVPVARSGTTRKLTLADVWNLPSASQLSWNSDTGLKRTSAAFVQVTNGSSGLGRLGLATGSQAIPAFSLDSSGNRGLWYNSGDWYWSDGSLSRVGFGTFGYSLASDMAVRWGTTTNAPGAVGSDTGLIRFAANAVRATDGSTGDGSIGGLTVIAGTRAGANYMYAGTMGARVASDRQHSWSSTTDANVAADTGMARNAAGIVAFTTGSGTTGTGAIALKDGAAGAGNYAIGFNGGAQIFATSSPALDIGTAAAGWCQFGGSTIVTSSTHQITWSSGAVRAAGPDTGLARAAAGIVQFTNGSSGSGFARIGSSTSVVSLGVIGDTTTGIQFRGSNDINMVSAGTSVFYFGTNRHQTHLPIGWATSTLGTTDVSLARHAAGVLRVGALATGSAIRGFLGGGSAVASATALPVPTGRVFHVTGTNNITSITSTNFESGAVVTLIFDDVLTFTDGNNLKLAGNFVTSADSTITLAYDGTNWYETSRSVN